MKEQVLNAMREFGAPVNAGKIAEITGMAEGTIKSHLSTPRGAGQFTYHSHTLSLHIREAAFRMPSTRGDSTP